MKTIGFIGLGLMGKPMAINLIKNGFKLNIWNRTISKTKPLLKYGATIKKNLKNLAMDSDVIITMLKDDKALIDVIENRNLLNYLKQNSLIIDMSSTDPLLAIKYANLSKKYNIYYLDAPVSGGTIGAKNGNLAIMVGGSKEIYSKYKKILLAMGNPTYLGKSGSGQIAKLSNQIIVGVTIGAVAEAILLANSCGINLKKLLNSLKGGFADSKILQLHGKRMIENFYRPGGLSSTQLKDMNNIIKVAKINNITLPLSTRTRKIYYSLVKNGYGDYDHSAFFKELLRLNKKK